MLHVYSHENFMLELPILHIFEISQEADLAANSLFWHTNLWHTFLPARASEQGNVIGLVSVYIYIYVCVQKKIVIERTRDLIYRDRLLPENN